MKKLPALMLFCLLLISLIGCSDNQAQNENVISSASTETINNVLNISDMSSDQQSPAITNKSWKDQFGNRYFIIYLGRIKMAEIYNIEAFYYANDTDEIKITQETVTTTTVMQSYRETVTSTTEWSDRAYVENTLSIEAGVQYGIFSAGVSDAFKTGYETTAGGSFVEEDESIFTQVISTTNRIMTEKSINCKQACTPGKYYRYSICGDVDCYMNLFIPADGSEATYEIASRLVNPNNTFDILFESDDYNSFSNHAQFSLEGLKSIVLEEPTETVKAYPEMTISATKNDAIRVNSAYLGKGHAISYDISEHFDTYYEMGYNKMKIEYSCFAMSNSDNGKLLVAIRFDDNEQSKVYGVTEVPGKSGKQISGSTEENMRLFKDTQKVYLHFNNEGWFDSFDMNDFTIKVTFYHDDQAQ